MGKLLAALFDIDGTLIDSNALHVAAWERVFAEAHHPIPASAIARSIGMGGDKLVPALWPEADETLAESLGALHGAIFKADYLHRAKPFPHARDLVKRAHDAGLKAVLATSGSKEEVDHYVDLLDIRDFLATQTNTDEVEQSKPAPDIFATALKKAAVSADEAIAIGDTPYDIEAAAASGIGTIAVLSGGFDREALSGAIRVYPDVAALLDGFEASPLAA